MLNLNNTLLELFLHIKSHTDTAYLVGGCVRDMVIGKTPKDYDIVTNCDLDKLIVDLKDNGWKINEAGKQFLVLIASKNDEQFEVALFRKDGTYTDGRRPDFVEIGDINSDAERRDLTFNALYYDPFTFESGKENVYLDPSKNGLSDIKNKLIRLNGNPSDRIKEDLLRIMRVYRFSNQLGFNIEESTLQACRDNFATMTANIPAERIKNEIEKMCNINDDTSSVIKLSGNPNERIKDDLMNIMYVYRSSNHQGLGIDRKTLKACRREFSSMIENTPAELIKCELELMCNL